MRLTTTANRSTASHATPFTRWSSTFTAVPIGRSPRVYRTLARRRQTYSVSADSTMITSAPMASHHSSNASTICGT